MYLVTKDFKGALNGCYVREFKAGDTVEIPCPDLVNVALAEGWITPVDALEGAPPKDTRQEYIVLQPKALPGKGNGWVGDLPKIGSTIRFDEAEAAPLVEDGVIALELPADFGGYIALSEVQLPEDGETLSPGASTILQEDSARELVEAGLLAPEGSEAAEAMLAKVAAEAKAAEKAAKAAAKAAKAEKKAKTTEGNANGDD